MANPSAAAQIKRALAAQVSPKAIQRAAARALNKAMTSTRAEASRRVREELSLKAGDIKKELTVEKAKAGDGLRNMRSTLVVSNRPVDLHKFGARARKVKSTRGPRIGVTVKVKDVRKLVVGGFIAKMRSGKVGIFKRDGATTSTGKSRIKLLYSTRVRDVFLNDGGGKSKSFIGRLRGQSSTFLDDLGDYAAARLKVVLTQELSFELGKAQAKAASKAAKGSVST